MLLLSSADFQKIISGIHVLSECHIAWIHIGTDRPPDKIVLTEIIFLISEPKHMFWVLKNRLNETVLLDNPNA